LQSDPGLAAKVFAAVVTLRLAIRDEDLDFIRLVHLKLSADYTAGPRPQPNELLKESFNQPAKLAERVIAPGEAAEPGETQTEMFGAHEVGDG